MSPLGSGSGFMVAAGAKRRATGTEHTSRRAKLPLTVHRSASRWDDGSLKTGSVQLNGWRDENA